MNTNNISPENAPDNAGRSAADLNTDRSERTRNIFGFSSDKADISRRKIDSEMLIDPQKHTLRNVFILVAVVAFVVLTPLIFLLSDRSGADEETAGSVVISEIMASNDMYSINGDSEYYDWIELYNNGSTTVNLDGYYLTDTLNLPCKWPLPEIKLRPSQYIVFIASGKDTEDKHGYYHTNFRISSEGESIALINPQKNTSSLAEMDYSPNNVSYGIVPTDNDLYEYMWLEHPTPGRKNCDVYADSPFDLPSAADGVVINEVMTDNTYTIYDRDGDYCDWVELYNTTSDSVNLSGCALSDNLSDPLKWTFPEGFSIAPGEYIVVFLSGKDRYDNDELHASFKLGSEDTVLLLSDPRSRTIDRMELPGLAQNVSYGVSQDGTLMYYSLPTPGDRNHESGFNSLSSLLSTHNRLVINEVSAASVDDIAGTALADWVEIFNSTPNSIDLYGYGLSNDSSNLSRFTFGHTTVSPGEYVVVNCTGGASADGEAPFKISCSGEELFLSDPAGNIIDSFSTGKLRIGASSGRAIDGSRLYFDSPSRGSQNPSSGYTGYTAPPVFSSNGGYVSRKLKLSVTAPENSVVRYTTDGSTPTEQSQLLDKSIIIDSSVTIKARAFSPSAMPSDTVFATFLVEEPHSLPVVCISSAEEGLFSNESGIFAFNPKPNESFPYSSSNFWKEWERETTVEYFVDGVKEVSFTAGSKIYGQYTRAYPQKSIALHLRDIYGASSVSYPFFNAERTEHSALILRAGGQDQEYTKVMDAFICNLTQSCSDSLLASAARPVVVYINGEYYGLYNLREKINEDYLERYEGENKNELDIIKNYASPLAGDLQQYNELTNYMRTHDLSIDEHYQHVSSQIDLESCIDYTSIMAFAINMDPANMKMFKGQNDSSKLRWILNDFDMAFRFYSHSSSFNYAMRHNYICDMLMVNESFRQQFIERFAYHLNNTFLPENTLTLWNSMLDEMSGEIERQYDRWSFPTPHNWSSHRDRVANTLSKRRDALKEQFIRYFRLNDNEIAELFPNG